MLHNYFISYLSNSLGNVGEHCFSHGDCSAAITNTVCRNSTCLCQIGYKPMDKNTKCSKIQITDSCMENKECSFVIKQSFCYQRQCSCQWGFKAINQTSCVPKAVGDGCTQRNESTDECEISVINSYCGTSEVCECVLGYKWLKHEHMCQKRIIGDDCINDLDCREVMPYSGCSNSKCRCMMGYKSSHDLTTCSTRLLGDLCQESHDCLTITNGKCLDTRCECPVGFYSQNKVSCQPFQLGTGCTLDLDCKTSVPHSHCHNNLLTPWDQIDNSRLSNKPSSSRSRAQETRTSTLTSSTGENSSSSPSSDLFITSTYCSCLLGFYALNTSTCLRSKLSIIAAWINLLHCKVTRIVYGWFLLQFLSISP